MAYQQPPYRPGRYPAQPNQPPPYQPGQVVSHRKMGFAGHAFHLTMCLMTFGLWIPVYMSRLRSRTTVTRYR